MESRGWQEVGEGAGQFVMGGGVSDLLYAFSGRALYISFGAINALLYSIS